MILTRQWIPALHGDSLIQAVPGQLWMRGRLPYDSPTAIIHSFASTRPIHQFHGSHPWSSLRHDITSSYLTWSWAVFCSVRTDLPRGSPHLRLLCGGRRLCFPVGWSPIKIFWKGAYNQQHSTAPYVIPAETTTISEEGSINELIYS